MSKLDKILDRLPEKDKSTIMANIFFVWMAGLAIGLIVSIFGK